MAMTAKSCSLHEEMEAITSENSAVLEEIDEDEGSLIYGKPPSLPVTPEGTPTKFQPVAEAVSQSPESPTKVKREFGNISPISELLDDDDLDIESPERETNGEDEECADDDAGKVTPEPGMYPNRGSFPRLSDGRSSPILAYSPSLIKSPSSNGSGKSSRIEQSSSPSGGSGGGIGKRPRNFARRLDNISDHSSGEEDVNSVGVMMAKFTV